MYVNLKELKPNPLRDFAIDPIDEQRVADLKASIKEDGFWGGIVCRRLRDGTIQIAAGHHRVAAAKAAGIKEADIFIGHDLDDAAMARIYTRENATQRGNSDTALAGSVAAAVRVLAKMLMTWTGKGGLAKFNQTSLAVLRGHLESENGLGHSAVLQLLGEDIPGINTSSVKPQLTSLKMSKDYSRIIGEVRDEIEVENREALKALAKIEKQRREAEEAERKAEEEAKAAAARKKAAKEEADRMRAEEAHQKAEAEAALAEKRRLEAEAAMKEFEALKRTRDTADAAATKSKASDDKRDEEKIGLDPRVRKLFDVPSHVEMFRRVVTAEGIRPYLPVENQFAMAKHVLAEWEKVRARRKAAGKAEGVLTAEFIRDTITQEAIAPKQYKRKVEKEEREARERSAAIEKVKRLLADFERHCNGLWRAGYELHEYITGKKWPKGTALPLSGGFAESVKHAREILTKIERKL